MNSKAPRRAGGQGGAAARHRPGDGCRPEAADISNVFTNRSAQCCKGLSSHLMPGVSVVGGAGSMEVQGATGWMGAPPRVLSTLLLASCLSLLGLP